MTHVQNVIPTSTVEMRFDVTVDDPQLCPRFISAHFRTFRIPQKPDDRRTRDFKQLQSRINPQDRANRIHGKAFRSPDGNPLDVYSGNGMDFDFIVGFDDDGSDAGVESIVDVGAEVEQVHGGLTVAHIIRDEPSSAMYTVTPL